MARLNEPVVAPDGLEILRRRFLRQNRDIARINSTQSLRIRSLENECARMLSENLQLRGRILHLESELRESSAQRIADHAMEIKEKMEAQLLEWGTMLASLGNEPLPRSRSPRAHKKQKMSPRRSSPLQWQRREPTREFMREVEAAAMHEGRLAPVWENKSCPRETLSGDEILALREEATELGDSPGLGPPPTSRFMQEDPIKLDLPTRSTQVATEAALRDESYGDEMAEAHDSQPQVEPRANDMMHVTIQNSVVTESMTEEIKSPPLKRKSRPDEERAVEDESKQSSSSLSRDKLHGTKPTNTIHAQPIRPIKSLPAGKKDNKPKTLNAISAEGPRKPLGIKNSNDAFASPKKAGKPPTANEPLKPKTDPKKSDGGMKSRLKVKNDMQTSTPVQISVPAPKQVPVVNVTIEQSLLSTEPNLSTPYSPESAVSREDAKDTPPPAHISSLGETARASRRARSSVSYAEPNLRDKMRRPTKELFDAVSGEGKNIRRHSQSKKDDLPSALGAISISGAGPSGEKNKVWRDVATTHMTEATEANPAAGIAASPLALKISKDVPTDSVSISLAMDEKQSHADQSAKTKEFNDESDAYDFPATTPEGQANNKRSSTSSRHSRARRLSTITTEDAGSSDTDNSGSYGSNGSKPAASRKRASMAAPKKSKMSLGHIEHDASIEGDSISSTSSGDAMDSIGGRDRGAMRRRSMML